MAGRVRVKKTDLICRRLKRLPKSMLVEAARTATRVNPVNHPRMDQLAGPMGGFRATPQRIAVMTTSYWGSAGVKLTCGSEIDHVLPDPGRDRQGRQADRGRA